MCILLLKKRLNLNLKSPLRRSSLREAVSQPQMRIQDFNETNYSVIPFNENFVHSSTGKERRFGHVSEAT